MSFYRTPNKLLKAEALIRSQKMKYRALSKDQVEQLTDGKDKDGQYNIAFKEDDKNRIDTKQNRHRFEDEKERIMHIRPS